VRRNEATAEADAENRDLLNRHHLSVTAIGMRSQLGMHSHTPCIVLYVAYDLEVKSSSPQAHDEQPPPRIRGVGLLNRPFTNGASVRV